MGGAEAYQRASALNTALNPTSKWVKRALAARKLGHTPRVLEIGAINTQLLETKELLVRAIDLHSSEPRIEQLDFFAILDGGDTRDYKPDPSGAVNSAPRPKLYDAVVCSMVLNCVPDGRRRFEMLVGIRSQLKAGGFAFVTLPRSCVDHSFTMNEGSFADAPLPPACIDSFTRRAGRRRWT